MKLLNEHLGVGLEICFHRPCRWQVQAQGGSQWLEGNSAPDEWVLLLDGSVSWAKSPSFSGICGHLWENARVGLCFP